MVLLRTKYKRHMSIENWKQNMKSFAQQTIWDRIIEKKIIWNILRKRVKLIGIVEECGLGTFWFYLTLNSCVRIKMCCVKKPKPDFTDSFGLFLPTVLGGHHGKTGALWKMECLPKVSFLFVFKCLLNRGGKICSIRCPLMKILKKCEYAFVIKV
jgi:hypothetical protein